MGSSIKSRNSFIKSIIEIYGFKCFYCKKPLSKYEEYGFDHIFPKSKGGKATKENIVPCCKSCNSSKSNYSFEQWFNRISIKMEESKKIYFYCKRIIKTMNKEQLI